MASRRAKKKSPARKTRPGSKARSKPKARSKAKPKLEREGYHLPIRSEQEQFEGLSEDLLDAWRALRAFCMRLGEQGEVRTSHKSIMFSRKTCYAFVRPKRKYIELNFFLGRTVASELIKKATAVSKTKYVHILELIHADQVESPLTDWLAEAFTYSG